MFTKVELLDAINELVESKHSIQNCEKLAAIYTVLDHLYPEEEKLTMRNEIIDKYGDTEFLQEIAGKPSREVWLLVDELIEALAVLNPKLLDNFYDKLSNIR